MEEKDFEFSNVEPGVWKYEKEGDSIFGVLIHREPRDEANDRNARYYLETNEGKMMVWGTAVLDDRLKLVEVGTPIRITFNGKQKNSKGRDINIFKVETGKKKQAQQQPKETTPTSEPAKPETKETKDAKDKKDEQEEELVV